MKVCKLMLVAGLSCGLFVAGCEQAKNSAEKAANAAGDAAKKAGEVAKDAGKAAGDVANKGVEAAKDAGKAAADTAGKAVDATKDAAHGAADAAKGAAGAVGDAAAKALEAAKAESSKWLTDTVGKQWPGIKTEIEGLGKSVEGIKDASIKTKAQGLLTDLKGQIPAVEKAVDGLKNFKDGDFTKMFGEVKTMWDNFGKKLGDLKGMLPK